MKCSAPWTHMVLNPNGEYRPCCMFKYPLEGEYKDIEEAFYSDEMDAIRFDMERGIEVEGCEKCRLDESHGSKNLLYQKNPLSYRQQFDGWYPEPPLGMRYLEISTSNRCNFKCVTCNDRFSNQFGEPIDNELPDPAIYENLDRLKLLGGEPFLDKRNIEIMKAVPRHNIELWLVTNGSIWPNEETRKLLNQFKKLIMSVSIDGYGELAEYVREGTKWSRIERNMNRFHYEFNAKPHFVFHSINAPFFEETTQQFDFPVKDWSTDYLLGPKWLDIQYLPVDIKQYIIERNPLMENALSKYCMEDKFRGDLFERLMSNLTGYPPILDDYVERLYGRVARY